MARFANTFANTTGVDMIRFKLNVQCRCPVGNAHYIYQVSVSMVPGEVVPDYVEVEKYMRGMSGRRLTIEAAVGEVFEYLEREYNPESQCVSIYCDDAVHFPVTVSKSY